MFTYNWYKQKGWGHTCFGKNRHAIPTGCASTCCHFFATTSPSPIIIHDEPKLYYTPEETSIITIQPMSEGDAQTSRTNHAHGDMGRGVEVLYCADENSNRAQENSNKEGFSSGAPRGDAL